MRVAVPCIISDIVLRALCIARAAPMKKRPRQGTRTTTRKTRKVSTAKKQAAGSSHSPRTTDGRKKAMVEAREQYLANHVLDSPSAERSLHLLATLGTGIIVELRRHYMDACKIGESRENHHARFTHEWYTGIKSTLASSSTSTSEKVQQTYDVMNQVDIVTWLSTNSTASRFEGRRAVAAKRLKRIRDAKQPKKNTKHAMSREDKDDDDFEKNEHTSGTRRSSLVSSYSGPARSESESSETDEDVIQTESDSLVRSVYLQTKDATDFTDALILHSLCRGDTVADSSNVQASATEEDDDDGKQADGKRRRSSSKPVKCAGQADDAAVNATVSAKSMYAVGVPLQKRNVLHDLMARYDKTILHTVPLVNEEDEANNFMDVVKQPMFIDAFAFREKFGKRSPYQFNVERRSASTYPLPFAQLCCILSSTSTPSTFMDTHGNVTTCHVPKAVVRLIHEYAQLKISCMDVMYICMPPDLRTQILNMEPSWDACIIVDLIAAEAGAAHGVHSSVRYLDHGEFMIQSGTDAASHVWRFDMNRGGPLVKMKHETDWSHAVYMNVPRFQRRSSGTLPLTAPSTSLAIPKKNIVVKADEKKKHNNRRLKVDEAWFPLQPYANLFVKRGMAYEQHFSDEMYFSEAHEGCDTQKMHRHHAASFNWLSLGVSDVRRRFDVCLSDGLYIFLESTTHQRLIYRLEWKSDGRTNPHYETLPIPMKAIAFCAQRCGLKQVMRITDTRCWLYSAHGGIEEYDSVHDILHVVVVPDTRNSKVSPLAVAFLDNILYATRGKDKHRTFHFRRFLPRLELEQEVQEHQLEHASLMAATAGHRQHISIPQADDLYWTLHSLYTAIGGWEQFVPSSQAALHGRGARRV